MNTQKRNKIIVLLLFLIAVLGSGYLMVLGYVKNKATVKRAALKGRTDYDIHVLDSVKAENKRRHERKP
jgi:hypothetical protein